jgi:hypothetical protein
MHYLLKNEFAQILDAKWNTFQPKQCAKVYDPIARNPETKLYVVGDHLAYGKYKQEMAEIIIFRNR